MPSIPSSPLAARKENPSMFAKKTLASILSTFTKTLAELDSFIEANAMEVANKTATIEKLRSERSVLVTKVEKAMKTYENIRAIVGD